MRPDFALAISVYDRFSDVRILVDILRHNWPGRFYIVVCSSHPEAQRHLADCAVDDLLKTEDIPVDPASYSWAEMHLHLTLRVLDSIRKTCARCASSGAPYTMHVHADALPLSLEGVQALTGRMAAAGKVFAARGDGWGFYTPREPVGAFDDMFFCFDNSVARSTDLWRFDLLDFLPHKLSVHGTLAALVLTRVGIRRFLYYATHADAVHWDGRAAPLPPLNTAHPMYFDPSYGFLHIHENAFPDDLGSRLKAYYLVRYGITKGAAVRGFIERWHTPPEALFEQLKALESGLQSFFHGRGLGFMATAVFDRDFARMDQLRREYRALSPLLRMRRLARLHASQLKTRCRRLHRAYQHRHVRKEMYRDMIWPESLQSVYQTRLKTDRSVIDPGRMPFGPPRNVLGDQISVHGTSVA